MSNSPRPTPAPRAPEAPRTARAPRAEWALRAAYALVALSLTACGGGGGGGGDAPAPSPTTPAPSPTTPSPSPSTPSPGPSPSAGSYDLGTALSSIYSTGFSARTVQATLANGSVITQTLTMTPMADQVFEGQTVRASASSTVTTLNGRSATESRTSYFTTTPFFQLLGDRLTTSGATAYTVAGSAKALPSAAKVGEAGEFLSSVTYRDSTRTNIDNSTAVTWSVEADPANPSSTSAYLCVNLKVTDYTTTGSPVTEGAVCYLLSPAGALEGVRSKIVFDGVSVDLR